MSETKLRWVATVGCEGGPVMVTNLPDFGQWTGAAPYVELRKLNENFREKSKDKMRTLHYWGQFTDKLPAPFKAEGGHQFLECATEAEAEAKLAELVRVVKEKLPKVEITEDDGDTHFLLPGSEDDDDEQMWAELSPKSEYDASWQAHEDDESWVHQFGKGRGLFWDMGGPGTCDVGVNAAGTELVVLRTWVDDEADEAKARALVDSATANEEAGGELVVASGKALIVWSPVAPFQLTEIQGPDDLAKLGDEGEPPSLDTELIGGVGTVVRLKAGRWVATLSSTEDDEDEDDEDDEDDAESSWSCRWLRLKWVGPA